jgi:hypothetical protein
MQGACARARGFFSRHLNQQLESMNQKYEDLQLLYTKAVKTNYAFKTELFLLKNENELLNARMDQREQFHNARCRRLQLQYDRLQVRYRDLRDNYYKEKNEHGDYGFDLCAPTTAPDIDPTTSRAHSPAAAASRTSSRPPPPNDRWRSNLRTSRSASSSTAMQYTW